MSEESKNLMKLNSFVWSPPDNLTEKVNPIFCFIEDTKFANTIFLDSWVPKTLHQHLIRW